MGEWDDDLPADALPALDGDERDDDHRGLEVAFELLTPNDDPFDDAAADIAVDVPAPSELDGPHGAEDEEGGALDARAWSDLLGDDASSGAGAPDDDAAEEARGDFGVSAWIDDAATPLGGEDHDGPLDGAVVLPALDAPEDHDAAPGEELHVEIAVDAALRGALALPRWADRAWDVGAVVSTAPLSSLTTTRAGVVAWGPRGAVLLGEAPELDGGPGGVPLGAVALARGLCVVVRGGTYARGEGGAWTRLGEASVVAADDAGGLVRVDRDGSLRAGLDPARPWTSVGRVLAVGSADGVGCLVCSIEEPTGVARVWRVRGDEARVAVTASVPRRVRVASVVASGERVALLGADGEVWVAGAGPHDEFFEVEGLHGVTAICPLGSSGEFVVALPSEEGDRAYIVALSRDAGSTIVGELAEPRAGEGIEVRALGLDATTGEVWAVGSFGARALRARPPRGDSASAP